MPADSFEHKLRARLAEAELPPDPGVWTALEKRLDLPPPNGQTGKRLWGDTLILLLLVFLYGFTASFQRSGTMLTAKNCPSTPRPTQVVSSGDQEPEPARIAVKPTANLRKAPIAPAEVQPEMLESELSPSPESEPAVYRASRNLGLQYPIVPLNGTVNAKMLVQREKMEPHPANLFPSRKSFSKWRFRVMAGFFAHPSGFSTAKNPLSMDQTAAFEGLKVVGQGNFSNTSGPVIVQGINLPKSYFEGTFEAEYQPAAWWGFASGLGIRVWEKGSRQYSQVPLPATVSEASIFSQASQTPFSEAFEFRITQISIPARFYIHLAKGRHGFELFGGASAQFNFQASSISETEQLVSLPGNALVPVDVSTEEDTELRPVSFTLESGANYVFGVSPRMGLAIGPEFRYQPRSFLKGYSLANDPRSFIGLRVGLMFYHP